MWRSTDQGKTWTPVFDSMSTLSIGALAVDPVDGSLWVGTGEANISQDCYAGTGVYRSTNDGKTCGAVGDDSLAKSPVPHELPDRLRSAGNAYDATDKGCSAWRLAATAGPRSSIPPAPPTIRRTTSR